jgi:hypothetical protein
MDLMINIAWAIVAGFGISTTFVFAVGGFKATPDFSERPAGTPDSQET